MNTVSATTARANLYDLIDEVASGKRVGITNKGETKAILVSQEEWNAMIVTLETLSDPELMEQIKESKKDIKAGRVHNWEDVKKEFSLEDVSDKTVKSRKKRA
ncbi:type II toxin-antitoxin system Phd/YefM family antitoxin [Candidatus Microgenomates bacterium]|nr:type II toxin-antitoxin system Phd/YefM family antitoxin [Candidatus Microgenomates bacterium]